MLVFLVIVFGWNCVSGRLVWDASREALSSGGSQFPAAVGKGVAIPGWGKSLRQ